MSMRANEGTGFFHPLTGQYVPPGGFYEGHVHRPHENQSVEDDTEQEITDDTTPLEELSHNKLKQLAKAKNIEGWSTKSKDELVELLKAAVSE